MGRPKGAKNKSEQDDLQSFAKRVELQVIKAGIAGSENMERLVCRLLTGRKTPQIAAIMAAKWVDWRYGKARETVKIEGYIEHTVFDASRLTDEQLAEAERLVESAGVGSNP
jgi:hypothetical protein